MTTLFILSYLAGALTILGPCASCPCCRSCSHAQTGRSLNALPLLQAASPLDSRQLQHWRHSWAAGRCMPTRLGGAIVVVATLAMMGVLRLAPRLATLFSRPFVALGARLGDVAERASRSDPRFPWASLLLGAATGLCRTLAWGPYLGSCS